METARKKTSFGIIAGVLFIAAAAYYVWNYMRLSSWPLSVVGWLNIGTLICIAVGFFLSQTKAGRILVLVGSIARAVYPFLIYQIIITRFSVDMIACVGFLLLAVAAILALSNGGRQRLGKTWFIPGLVMVAYVVLYTVRYGIVLFSLVPCLITIGTVLGGLALAKPEKTVTQPVTAAKRAGSLQAIEELKKYKELLDSGVISQEEYDAKKKQLLEM